jgi:4-hydroxybenzoate polyprenyltransferase
MNAGALPPRRAGAAGAPAPDRGPAEPPAPGPVPAGPAWRAALELARPAHWIKNVFVLAGAFFAQDWRDPAVLAAAGAAFAAFCLAASAVYACNDALDAEEDRLHPRKRARPVAAGRLPAAAAYALAAGLGAAALGIGQAAGPRLQACLIGYGLVNLLYSRLLKRVVLADVFCIAAGFLLRLLAGTWGIGVEPSEWFLLCTLNLSLFLGFSKRYAERVDPLRPLEEKREVLRRYSPDFLRTLLGITLASTVITYGLYTTSPRAAEVHPDAHLIYTLPIALFGLFRYLYLVMEKGFGENTVADVGKDKALLLVCAAYVAVCLLLLAD